MEIPFNILILPFLGGYIFVRFWNYTRIHTMRSDKDRIIIRSAIVGLFSIVFAFILNGIGTKLFPCNLESTYCFGKWWRETVPFEHSGISFGAFLIGAIGWLPLNFFFTLKDQINRAINEDADPLEMLLKRAQDNNFAVSITMVNEKVYVGMITHVFNPATPTLYIGILPLQSGFRDPETKQMHLKINYAQAMNKMIEELDNVTLQIEQAEEERATKLSANPPEPTDELDESIEALKSAYDDLEIKSNLFQVVIPVNQIASANIYDSDIHQRYFMINPANP